MHTSARLTGSLLLLAALGLTTGCDALSVADTPLDITADRIAYQPGEAVTGEVINPDGTVTITLARSERRGPDAAATSTCDYDPDEETFSCATSDLPLGPYAVQVTDDAQPGEGTKSVAVVLSDVEDFDPTVGTVPQELDTGEAFPREAYVVGTAGRATPVPVTGWGAERRLTLTVTADGGGKVVTKQLTTDSDGAGMVRIKPLKAAEVYYLAVTDGTWTTPVPMKITAPATP